MSKKYKDKPRESKKEIYEKNQIPVPVNCSHPCAYGRARSYCFPCYAKILKEFREKKQEAGN